MKGIKHALCYRALRGALLVGLSLAGVQVAFANWSVNPGNYNVGYHIDWGHGVQPHVGWNPAPTGAPAAGGSGYSIENGRVVARGAGKVNIGPTVIDVQAKIRPSGAAVGRAVLNAAKKLAVPWVVGNAIYDLFKELEGSQQLVCLRDQSTGALSCQQTIAGSGYVYRLTNGTCERSSGADTCVCAKGAYAFTAYYDTSPYGRGCFSSYSTSTPSPSNFDAFVNVDQIQTTGGSTVAVTDQQIADIIAAESGWPSSSHLPGAVVEAINSGEPITATELPTVTGPASVPGPTTTKTDSQGNVTNTSTTHNITYNVNNITYNTTTVTTVNGVTQSTETKAAEPEPPSDQCEKYPNSAGCADLDTPDGEIPKTTKNVTFNPENLGFGGGTCPADKMVTLRGMPQPVKVFDWQDTCGKLQTYARPMILALATFAALMIIFGARVE